MRFSENRVIAYIVLALAIALSLYFGGGGGLMDKRALVDEVYHTSSESISAELHEMRDNAVTLLSIARKYDEANAEYEAELEQAVAALEGAQDASDAHAASLRLDSAVEHVYSDLTGLDLSDMDAEDARYKYKNFTSAQLRIEHDPYNEMAVAFNEQLAAFPANLLGRLRGVEPLTLFR